VKDILIIIHQSIVEQDHRPFKKRVRFMFGLKSSHTTTFVISRIEAMNIVEKEQLVLWDKSHQNQV
jgi:transposase-like protein